MRRALVSVLVLVALALALTACGSSSSAARGPRDTELSYVPPGSPLVLMAATDPNGTAYQNASGFIARFPIARLGLAALQSALAGGGVNFGRDVKPLLGNPIALAAGDTSVLPGSSKRFVIAFVARDAGKLAALIRNGGAQGAGTYDGAKLSEKGSTAAAIDGATIVLSDSLADLKSALDVHAHHQGLSAAAYDKALAGLPQNTLLQVYGSLTGVLARPSAAKARLVPWVAALRSYAVTLSVTDTGITAGYRLDTSGAKLATAQLPLPLGSSAPSVAGQAPLAVGIRQLAHVIAFGEAAAQAVDPASYAKLIRQGAAEGVDLNRQIVSQFTGDAEVDYAAAGAIARVDVRDPAAARRTLAKLRKFKFVGGGFYESTTARHPARVGIVGTRLVIGSTTPAQLRAFASAPASPIAGAPGPIAFRVAVGALVARALAARGSSAGAGNPMIQGVLNMFGDITGYAANDASSLHGSFSLPLK